MLLPILKRISQSLLVLFVVAFIAFFMFRYLGDPIAGMFSPENSDSIQNMQDLRESLGLNKPFIVQLFTYIKNALTGNFGMSYTYKVPVASLLLERFSATFEVALFAMIISLLFAIPTGIYVAIKPNSVMSNALSSFTILGSSIPTFVAGFILIFLFSVNLRLLPSFGRDALYIGSFSTSILSFKSIQYMIMPVLTLALNQSALIMRLVRSQTQEILAKNYYYFAKSLGVRPRILYTDFILANIMLPLINVIGIQFGNLLAFSIVTESIFQWPGMGQLFIQAINTVDIPIISTYLILIACFFVIINIVVDILNRLLDPRITIGVKK